MGGPKYGSSLAEGRKFVRAFFDHPVHRYLDSFVGKMPVYHVEGSNSKLVQVNTRVLKITEEKVLPLL